MLSVGVCNVVHGRVQRTKRHVETDNRHISSVSQDVVGLKRLRNAEEMVGGINGESRGAELNGE